MAATTGHIGFAKADRQISGTALRWPKPRLVAKWD
jgi:hypothetical protein